MTNRLKSPESGVSRRDLLRAGGIALVAGVALAGCAGTGTGSNETRQGASETQRSDETERNGTSENELTESKEDTEKLKVNKEAFDGWENKTFEERQAVFDEWLELNDIKEPMPEYIAGKGTHKYAEAIARWFIKHRCRPLGKAYRDPDLKEYAILLARDVLTCNGKNPKGSDNGLYKAICDDYADRFDPKTPFAYDPYTFCGVTDIDESKDTPDNPGELVPCCIVMLESGSFETDTLVYLWVQLAFGADKYGPNTVRAIMSSYSGKPRLEKHPEIEFYEVNKQTV